MIFHQTSGLIGSSALVLVARPAEGSIERRDVRLKPPPPGGDDQRIEGQKCVRSGASVWCASWDSGPDGAGGTWKYAFIALHSQWILKFSSESFSCSTVEGASRARGKFRFSTYQETLAPRPKYAVETSSAETLFDGLVRVKFSFTIKSR